MLSNTPKLVFSRELAVKPEPDPLPTGYMAALSLVGYAPDMKEAQKCDA